MAVKEEVLKTFKLALPIGFLLTFIAALLCVVIALLPWGFKEGKWIFLPLLPERRTMELCLSFASGFMLVSAWAYRRFGERRIIAMTLGIPALALLLFGVLSLNEKFGFPEYGIGLKLLLATFLLHIIGMLLVLGNIGNIEIEVQLIKEEE